MVQFNPKTFFLCSLFFSICLIFLFFPLLFLSPDSKKRSFSKKKYLALWKRLNGNCFTLCTVILNPRRVEESLEFQFYLNKSSNLVMRKCWDFSRFCKVNKVFLLANKLFLPSTIIFSKKTLSFQTTRKLIKLVFLFCFAKKYFHRIPKVFLFFKLFHGSRITQRYLKLHQPWLKHCSLFPIRKCLFAF